MPLGILSCIGWIDQKQPSAKAMKFISSAASLTTTIKKSLEDKGIKCWDIKFDRFSKNIFKNISISIYFRKFCKQINPDIIHLITIKPIIFGGLYARFAGIPFIVSFVG
jgi:hypothetical protein